MDKSPNEPRGFKRKFPNYDEEEPEPIESNSSDQPQSAKEEKNVQVKHEESAATEPVNLTQTVNSNATNNNITTPNPEAQISHNSVEASQAVCVRWIIERIVWQLNNYNPAG